jgi:hypothetical protein
MKKHLLVGTFGAGDNIDDISQPGEIPTIFPLVIGNNSLNFGIAEVLQELYTLGNYPTEIGLDLMIIAAHVFAADTRVSRRTESQDSWTREMRLVVPVSDPVVWSRSATTLKTLLDFLTGEQIIPAKPTDAPEFRFDKLQLFSGGLDSLIRTIDNLEQGESPLLISHAGDGATSHAQNECLTQLRANYTAAVFNRLRLWMNIPSNTFTGVQVENTTRGRSFLFFSLGVLAGTGMANAFVLEAPENGLIALNVPLDILRLGSLSTHTTHPFYIEGWNSLMSEVGIFGMVVNPYGYLTKGEMVQACNNKPLLQQVLSHSMSCSSPAKARWQGHALQHCGYCLPCLIRRASLHNQSGITDDTVYTIQSLTARPLNSMQAEGHQVRSFQIAARRLLQSPRIANFVIHKSGPLPQESQALSSLANVYLRGMAEIGSMLQGVSTEPQG